MQYKVGTILNVDGIEGTVIGYIEYANPEDNGNRWTEYRLKTKSGERWLSIDEVYKEYSISQPANYVRGKIGPEWHEVDKGTQVVVSSSGEVDVDYGEKAMFVEYEDETEEKTLSVEIWSDGTEYSTGYYLDADEITVIGMEKASQRLKRMWFPVFVYMAAIFIICFISSISSIIKTGLNNNATIEKYLKKSALYTYETSITGNEKQKADVYTYFTQSTTDDVAKDIINGIRGNTESVTQKDDATDEEIAIVTKKEYCLVYHPEDDPLTVLVQISNRKYTYTSDNSPYRSSDSGTKWYRSHYYSTGYSSDAGKYSSTPSAYSSYSGDTVHNIGNGYFDTYAGSVRQSSINSRDTSSGGLSSGK